MNNAGSTDSVENDTPTKPAKKRAQDSPPTQTSQPPVASTPSTQHVSNENIDPVLLAADAVRQAEEETSAAMRTATRPQPKPAYKGTTGSNVGTPSSPADSFDTFGGFNFPRSQSAFTTPTAATPTTPIPLAVPTVVTPISLVAPAPPIVVAPNSLDAPAAPIVGTAESLIAPAPAIAVAPTSDIASTNAPATVTGRPPLAPVPHSGQLPPPAFESRPPTRKPKPATEPKPPPTGNGQKRKSAGGGGVGRKKRKSNGGEVVQVENGEGEGGGGTPPEGLQYTATSNNAQFAKKTAAAAKKKPTKANANLVNPAGEHPLVIFPPPSVPVGPAPTVSSRGRKITRGTNRDGTVVELPVKRGRAGK